MANNQSGSKTRDKISAQPRLHQRAAEIQSYGTVNQLPPLELEEPVRLEVTGPPEAKPVIAEFFGV